MRPSHGPEFHYRDQVLYYVMRPAGRVRKHPEIGGPTYGSGILDSATPVECHQRAAADCIRRRASLPSAGNVSALSILCELAFLAVGSLLLLSRWRWFQDWLASSLGVANGAVALILLAGCAFIVVVYRLSIRISGLRDSNIKLARQLAILELRLEVLDEKDKTPGQPNNSEISLVARSSPLRLPFVLVWIVCGPAINGPFVFDDRFQVFLQPDRASVPFLQWIRSSRPLLIFTFWLNYQAGGTAPFGYHAVNVLLHSQPP